MLPILEHKDLIVRTIEDHQVTIVVGETGSGKTTMLPIFLYQAGFAGYLEDGIIGITEPRRIAATSVARFVAEKLGGKLGETVGYQIRFDGDTGKDASVKFMTDGILLREIQLDPDLKKYSVIMIDEAHERSQNIDFLLGLLKDVLTRRDDLRIVISSATIDANKFSQYFSGAPIINIEGRTFNVDVKWTEKNISFEDMADAVVERVCKICADPFYWDGDILIFTTGEAEIKKIIRKLEEQDLRDIVFLPAHGSLPPEDQQRIFAKFPGQMKVIVATNIAETSITVDGVVYVIDTGLVKQTHFDSYTGIQSLDEIRHSQAGCDQRAGRAGRTQPGHCFRLYAKADFQFRPRFTEPEIKRTSLASVVLAMESLGIDDIENFDFIDPPDKDAFAQAYQALIMLGAITKDKTGLTELGERMSALPLEPTIARMVLEAEKHKCTAEIVTIAAFLSVRSVFCRPKDKELEADEAHRKFKNEQSDALTYLAVWEEYKSSNFRPQWCFDNFLNNKTLKEVRNIRSQLLGMLKQSGIEYCCADGDSDKVLRCVVSGLIGNLVIIGGRNSYHGVLHPELNCIFTHPSSSLFNNFPPPRFLVFTRTMETTKRFAHGCTAVEPEWLPELAPSMFYFGQSIVSGLVEDATNHSEKKLFWIVRPVFRRSQYVGGENELIGYRKTQVSFEVAKAVYKTGLKKLRKHDWLVGTIDSLSLFDKRVRFHDGSTLNVQRCPTLGFNFSNGDTYYCRVSTQSELVGRGKRFVVDPWFKAFECFAESENELGYDKLNTLSRHPDITFRIVLSPLPPILSRQTSNPKPALPEPIVPEPIPAKPVDLRDPGAVTALAGKWGASVKSSKRKKQKR